MSKHDSRNDIALKGEMDRNDIIDMLERLVQGFKKGAVCLRKGSESMTLSPADHVGFGIEAEIKKDKQKVVIELRWEYDAELAQSREAFYICAEEQEAGAGVAFSQASPVACARGMNSAEDKALVNAWSIKNEILSKDVYNDTNEKVGSVEDLIVTPEKAMSYAIVGTGGFLGMARHDVAIPVHQFKMNNDRIVLPGATKVAVKAMPEFKPGVHPQ
jgi:amphi-Trp domain-containing protein